ncbi:MAG: orotidine-5'-phosphate decarboxylase [Armatimonadetes bacterium]|nr:orotidine-5'-phosphate decarboxylase [Armatimonadota bacterium]
MNAAERIIIPLDVRSTQEAVRLVESLRDHVGAFKVGLELVHAAGFGVFDAIRLAGAERVFYDCKLHDIPNTVAGAVRAIAAFGVWMFNVHASGGSRMMAAAARALGDSAGGSAPPMMLGVTLLTSLDARDLANELHVDLGTTDYVMSWARLARQNGCAGVVCSPHEVAAVRQGCDPDLVIVTPGIRPAWAASGDQRRVMTPLEAVRAGADYIVIGRPITGADDPAGAARRVTEELEADA